MTSAAQNAIKNGSKSFYLASLFFSPAMKADAWALYRWCRLCDDRIDEGGSIADLDDLRFNTLLAIRDGRGPDDCVALGDVCARRSIPEQYPLALLEGFEKDVRRAPIRDQADLEQYAYHVAGVVGMMMAHVMGADLPAAGHAAKCMGNAMQLTNIARDVREDFARGRVYLPQAWLEEAGIDQNCLMSAEQRPRVFAVVQRLLERADGLYAEGRRGLSFLPFRAALAVSIAASIYSAIGRRILRTGPAALDSRAVVPLWQKLILVFDGAAWVLRGLPERLLSRRGASAGA